MSTALVDPHVRPSGIFAQCSTVRYGLSCAAARTVAASSTNRDRAAGFIPRPPIAMISAEDSTVLSCRASGPGASPPQLFLREPRRAPGLRIGRPDGGGACRLKRQHNRQEDPMPVSRRGFLRGSPATSVRRVHRGARPRGALRWTEAQAQRRARACAPAAGRRRDPHQQQREPARSRQGGARRDRRQVSRGGPLSVQQHAERRRRWSRPSPAKFKRQARERRARRRVAGDPEERRARVHVAGARRS